MQLTSAFAEELGNKGFKPDDDFFEFGGHSLSALQLILQVEQDFGVSISTVDLYQAPTPRSLMERLELAAPEKQQDEKDTSKRSSRLSSKLALVIPLQTKGNRPPIIALHLLGENASHFRPLSKALGEDQPFWCIGEARSPNLYNDWVGDPNSASRVEDVAGEYVDEICKLFPEGPVALIGTCLGALYAYEVAQQLTARGRQPMLLCLQRDTHAPEMQIVSKTNIRRLARKEARTIGRLGFWKTLGKLPRLPRLISRWTRRVSGEFVRKREIQALANAKAGKRSMTHRLAVRDYIEKTLASVHHYDYRPYAGATLMVRDSAENTYPDPSANSAYGSRLSDYQIAWHPEDQLGPDGVAGKRAALIRERMDELGAAESQQPEVSSLEQEQKPTPHVSPPQAFSRDSGRFRVTAKAHDPNAIPTPRSEQRQWLVGERLRELSNELDHLDEIAPKMISASGSLTIDGRDVAPLQPDEIMEDWQIPLMRSMAKIAAQAAGDVLEVGYGRGISSRMIQEYNPRSHTIIECNPTIVADAELWKSEHPDRDIRIVQGYWQDVVDDLDLFDGILFHTYPLSVEELSEVLSKYSTYAENFFPHAAKLLRPGGRFTYFTNDADSLSRAHQRALLEHFASYKIGQIRDLQIPETSADAHWFDRIVTIEATAGK